MSLGERSLGMNRVDKEMDKDGWKMIKKTRPKERTDKFLRLYVNPKAIQLRMPDEFRRKVKFVSLFISKKTRKLKIVPISQYIPEISWKVNSTGKIAIKSALQELDVKFPTGHYFVPYEIEGDSIVIDLNNALRKSEYLKMGHDLTKFLADEEKGKRVIKKMKERERERKGVTTKSQQAKSTISSLESFLRWMIDRLEEKDFDDVLKFDPTQYRLTIPSNIYEEWGRPEWVEVRVDMDDSAFIIYPIVEKPIGFMPYKVDEWGRFRPKKVLFMFADKEDIKNWPNFLLYREDPDGGLRVWIPGGMNDED